MVRRLVIPRYIALYLLLLSGLAGAGLVQVAAVAAGFQGDEALQLGERLYREGILSDGKPVQAIVAGDIAVDGRMFTCINCHQRSGLGSVEGSIVTWPINGKVLFVPRRRTGAWNPAAEGHGPGSVERWSLPPQYQAVDARPAYTAETLARAIRTGVAADGRVLSQAMPRYTLEDGEMELLIHYMRNLSVNNAPGVDAQTLRFATVVTDGVSADDRDAMLAVLQAHIDARNTQTRPHQRRARQGPFYKTEQYGSYRKLALDVWELNGPPETWREQLESYYRLRPVFALLGGIGSGSWAPIHAFCEDNEIPNIFPVTDHPVVSESDWYTLYFSKGFYQEGETAARFLQTSGKTGPDTRIVQVYRKGSEGEALARGFQDAWAGYGGRAPENRQLGANDALATSWWQEFADTSAPVVLLLWLAAEEVTEALRSRVIKQGRGGMLFASGSLLEGKLDRIPAGMRKSFYMTYPASLPGENKNRLMALQRWLKVRGIPATNLDIQSRMYFLGWLLPDAMKHMRGEFYRDYFLETFDMMTDQDAAIAVFPRLSFGPGQRYASKGCYIVQLSGDENPELVKVSNWVIN